MTIYIDEEVFEYQTISDSEPASDERSPARFSYLGSQSSTGTGLPIFDDSKVRHQGEGVGLPMLCRVKGCQL